MPEKIISLENKFISELKPAYNILKTAFDSTGYKHTEETKQKMRDNYGEERRKKIGSLNKDKELSAEVREKLSLAMKSRHKSKCCDLTAFKQSKSRPTIVSDLFGKMLKEYTSAKEVTKDYSIDYRTIRRHLKNGKPLSKQGIKIEYKL